MFKIKKVLSLDVPCNILEKLFDTLVAPIILYGSEVWGIGKPPNDSDPYEHLHLKFIKEILGVNSKTTNIACLIETNRTSLHLKVQLNSIKFLNHIIKSPDTLVNDIYNSTKNNNLWISHIKNIINKLGFGHLNLQPDNIQCYITRIEQRLSDQFKQNLIASLSSSEKLSFLSKIFTPFKRPPYIDLCRSRADRSIISKFRLSAHSLEIEKGRYNKIERKNRICKLCNRGEIEDEYHFFSICPHYLSYRNQFRICLDKLHFLPLSKPQLTFRNIANIFNSNSIEILKLTVKFMKDCWDGRAN